MTEKALRSMIGFGKAWKAIGSPKPEVLASTIPRDVMSRKSVRFEPSAILSDIEPSETRAAQRFVPVRTRTVLTTTNGKRLAARIINVSGTGVAVEPEIADLRAEDVAKVGSHPVTPGRRVAHGIVLVFLTPLKEDECGPHIVL